MTISHRLPFFPTLHTWGTVRYFYGAGCDRGEIKIKAWAVTSGRSRHEGDGGKSIPERSTSASAIDSTFGGTGRDGIARSQRAIVPVNGGPRGRAARPGGRRVARAGRRAARETLSSRTYIGRPGCPPRGRRTAPEGIRSAPLAASTGDGGRESLARRTPAGPRAHPGDLASTRHGRSREEFASRGTSGAAPGKVVSPATGDPGLMDELPQVVPRSGCCHGDRRRRDTRAALPARGEEGREGGGGERGRSPGSILRSTTIRDDPRPRKKKWQRPCGTAAWIRYATQGFDLSGMSRREG